MALLAQEKELTRLRDAISRQRRELPWVRIDKDYRFEGPRGTQILGDLFEVWLGLDAPLPHVERVGQALRALRAAGVRTRPSASGSTTR